MPTTFDADTSRRTLYTASVLSPVEIRLHSTVLYENPFVATEIDATFTHTDGTTVSIPGFWREGGDLGRSLHPHQGRRVALPRDLQGSDQPGPLCRGHGGGRPLPGEDRADPPGICDRDGGGARLPLRRRHPLFLAG